MQYLSGQTLYYKEKGRGKLELIGFVLLCIGLMIFFYAKRIIRGKTKLEPEDEREMRLLTSGAVIAVKMSGVVVAAIGLIFLALGAAMRV